MKKKEEKTQEIRKCKKCQRPLPENYNYDKCENCRGKQVENVKKGIVGVGGTLLSIGLLVVSGGKFGGKKS